MLVRFHVDKPHRVNRIGRETACLNAHMVLNWSADCTNPYNRSDGLFNPICIEDPIKSPTIRPESGMPCPLKRWLLPNDCCHIPRIGQFLCILNGLCVEIMNISMFFLTGLVAKGYFFTCYSLVCLGAVGMGVLVPTTMIRNLWYYWIFLVVELSGLYFLVASVIFWVKHGSESCIRRTPCVCTLKGEKCEMNPKNDRIMC